MRDSLKKTRRDYLSDYYCWLVAYAWGEDVGDVSVSDYTKLFEELYSIDFIWLMDMDENRAEAGLQLRREYAFEAGVDASEVGVGPCSVLEMLVALAIKLADQTDGEHTIGMWFWTMILNLELAPYSDNVFDKDTVDYIIYIWLNRMYDPDGEGSLFPLNHYDGDQRRLEILESANAYINEYYPLDDDWLN